MLYLFVDIHHNIWFYVAQIRQLVFLYNIIMPHTNFNKTQTTSQAAQGNTRIGENHITVTSHWGDTVSNHQPHGCLLNRLFRRRSKQTSKLRVTGLCAGNSPGTGEFPAQMASNAENVCIWWRHHEFHFSSSWSGNEAPQSKMYSTHSSQYPDLEVKGLTKNSEVRIVESN